ncbi:MAG TPA: T9SS type A sorting domain-containing protein [Saprospiraceae bacterium]|nr:T9SS type A sorting domain-containing protein [Saprospiraceae bacterium]
MILTEAEATGETGGDSDGDGIAYIAGGNKPFVFASEASFDLSNTAVINTELGISSTKVFPNPARESIVIEINMNQKAKVDIAIFDVNGKLVASKLDNNLSKGVQQIHIDLKAIAAGNYFIRAAVNHQLVAIEKLMIL